MKPVLPLTPANFRHVWGPRIVGLVIGAPIALLIFALAEWGAR